MNLKNNYPREEMNEKISVLDKARTTLKQEFIGIDAVIDAIIDHISNWFLFPGLQDRPLILNLWGMTGVGKTALIIRLAELLDFNKRFFRYDMGNSAAESKSLREDLTRFFRNSKTNAYMLMLDEFQHARTLDEDGQEIRSGYSRVIWDLLDAGKFQSGNYNEDLAEKLMLTKELLTQALSLGVEIEKGVVVQHEDEFEYLLNQYMDNDFASFTAELINDVPKEEQQRYEILPSSLVPALQALLKGAFKTILDCKQYLDTLSLEQLVKFIEEAIEKNICRQWIDCSRSVIFILGNLDEAFTMSSSYNPDYNADDFHEASQKISINHIKRALRRRFRNEQIARLGNNHIIYPAFSSDTFKKLICIRLDKCHQKALSEFGIHLLFTPEFRQLIYEEGVYPTQGTRPLFSTIYQMVDAQLPQLIARMLLRGLQTDCILFHFTGQSMEFIYCNNNKEVHRHSVKIQLKLGQLRKPGKDDLQAIVAVHEAGHAVLCIAGLKIIPDCICSTTADIDSAGFISVTNNKRKYLSKDMIIPKIAECLAGLAAEKLVFGEQYITRGSQDDLDTATALAARSVKDYGFGQLKALANVASFHTKNEWHDTEGEINREVRALLEQGWALAEEVLTKEKNLLLQLSDYLSEERVIKREQIIEMVRQYGTQAIQDVDFDNETNYQYYRAKLKEQVQSLTNHPPVSLVVSEPASFSLNKKM